MFQGWTVFMVISLFCLSGRYCENRRKVLLEHVHEGYDKDWWEYTE